MEDDQILDPAHDPNAGENLGAAGLGRPDDKKDDKPYKMTDDKNIVEVDGVKYVRGEALHNERQARQKAEAILAELDPVLPEFNEFLKTKEQRKAATRDTVVRDTGGDKDDEDYLQEVATALGFYTETNEPDLRRAQAHLNITRREAGRVTDKRVRPVEENSARDRARANKERIRGQKFVDGQPIAEDRYLEAAHNALPEEYLADPQVAALTQIIAAGLQHLDERKNGTARRGGGQRRQTGEPMLVERGTGRYDGDDGENISALDAAAARARGKTPEQWSKISKAVNSSRAALDEVN